MGVSVTRVERQSMVIPPVERYLHAVVIGHRGVIDDRYIRQIGGAYVLRIEPSARAAWRARIDASRPKKSSACTGSSEWPCSLLRICVGRAVVIWSRIAGAGNARGGRASWVGRITPPRTEAADLLRLIHIGKPNQLHAVVADVINIQAEAIRDGPLDAQTPAFHIRRAKIAVDPNNATC